MSDTETITGNNLTVHLHFGQGEEEIANVCRRNYENIQVFGSVKTMRKRDCFSMRIKLLVYIFLIGIVPVLYCGCVTQREKESRAILHARGIDFSSEAFFDAVRNNENDTVEFFLDAGFNPNAICQKDGKGWTALFYAVQSNYKDMVETLIGRGSNPNGASKLGHTPLHYAAFHADTEALQRLLDSGANVNSKSYMGYTPLMIASREGNSNAVKLLLKHGANIRLTELGRGFSAWDLAGQRGHYEILKIFSEALGVDFEAPSGKNAIETSLGPTLDN